MSASFTFQPELHLASLATTNPTWHRLSVHTLLQDPGQRQPSINAYLGARYSRSADSVATIAAEAMAQGTDAAKRLETIFQNYGHKSVGDMADLFVCIENVPMVTAMRLFYLNPVQSGQERSTRYQNFQDPVFVDLPDRDIQNQNGEKLRDQYRFLIREWLRHYSELLEPTRAALAAQFQPEVGNKQQESALGARTFDTVRYVLPLGLETSLGVVMSARNWAETMSVLRASHYPVERELAEYLFSLLTGATELHGEKIGGKKKDFVAYLPEAAGLLRHTQANMSRSESTRAVLELVGKGKGIIGSRSGVRRTATPSATVSFNHQPIDDLIRHLQLLTTPLSKKPLSISDAAIKKIGTALFDSHNHHNLIGQLAQTGAIAIEGWADFGVLKDLNRHRSFERFVPLWHAEHDLAAELDRPSDQCFFVCDYLHLKSLHPLRREYHSRMAAMYDQIKTWYSTAQTVLSPELARQYTTYLLPHAHATRYRFYASIDDLQYVINLRTRNGGHIAYRQAVYDWLEKAANKSPFWQPLVKKLPKVDAASREQFFDRS